MSPLWAYLWPLLAFSAALGLASGTGWFRRRRLLFPAAGVLFSLGAAALWHGPFGAADRFSASVETAARQTLAAWDMGQVQSHLHHDPLTRRLDLSGPADDFQRSELVRIMGSLPGVSSATWSDSGGLPLIALGMLVSLMAFVVGLILAYVVELRRRYNAQWNW